MRNRIPGTMLFSCYLVMILLCCPVCVISKENPFVFPGHEDKEITGRPLVLVFYKLPHVFIDIDPDEIDIPAKNREKRIINYVLRYLREQLQDRDAFGSCRLFKMSNPAVMVYDEIDWNGKKT